MKMKKVLCLVLALVLAIGVLAGCGGGNVKTSAKVKDFKHTDEKLEISWLSYATLAGCKEGTAPEKLLESKFNVEIKPIFVEGGSYQDKKSAMLASGEIPDLIYELDPAHVFKDVEDEFLFEVQYEVIKEHAPELYASINDKAPAVWSYSYYDEKNWGMPNINHSHMTARVPMYRKDWLEKVDKEIPTNVDELHDVLKAFVDAKLGKDATYGYTMTDSHYQYYFGEIFGAYGVLPFDWQEVNGEIVYGGLRPEVETVLGILQQWYKEGIIYPAYAEGNAEKNLGNLLTASQIGYANFYGYQAPEAPNGLFLKTRAIDPNADFVWGEFIKGPKGDYGMRGWGYPCHVVSFGAADETGETTPKKITRMLEMFEGMYTDEALLMQVRYGKEGEQYEVDYDSKTSAGAFSPIGKYEDAANRRLEGYEFGLAGPTFWSPFAPSDKMNENTATNGYKKWLEKYPNGEGILYDEFYKVDIIPSAAEYLEVLRTEQIKLMNQIIMGQSTVKPDQFCEEFEKIWNANGGEQMLSEAKDQKKVNEEIIAQLP